MRSRIIDAIERSGPIPFERFMQMALYDSESGYFGSGALRSEKAGDFLTSPEVSPLFGETLGIYVGRERDRIGDPFQLVEVGAGSGSLLRPLLSVMSVDAVAVEASPAARAVLADRVPAAVVTAGLPQSIRGVVIANELIDNLPMALAQMTQGRWRERWVGADGEGLVFVDADPRPEVEEWLARFAGPVPEGGWVEVQIAAGSWLTDVLSRTRTGSVVLIDYGDTSEGLAPRRQDGTLRTYRAHHLGPHPLDVPGEADITADVNFSALMSVAEDCDGDVEVFRQDDFLTGLGLRERLSDLRRAELDAARRGDEMDRLRLRSLKTEAETLLHPRGLGDFRVLIARK